jgi:hypothetical protein
MRNAYRFDRVHFFIAFEAVHGYRDGYCESNVTPSSCFISKHFLADELFIGPNRLKCYQCAQLSLIKILDEIVGGKEYSKSGGKYMLLDHLLINAHRHISRNVVVGPSSQPLPFKESITEELLWF